MSIHQKKWLIVLLVCGLIYFLFHEIRHLIPIEFIRNSLPSILVAPVMFGVTELTDSIKFHSFSLKIVITLLATALIAFWFEGVVPGFYQISVRDIDDVLGIFLGWFFYIGISYWENFSCNSKRLK